MAEKWRDLWEQKRKLTEAELRQIIEDENFFDFPLDNAIETDVESDDDDLLPITEHQADTTQEPPAEACGHELECRIDELENENEDDASNKNQAMDIYNERTEADNEEVEIDNQVPETSKKKTKKVSGKKQHDRLWTRESKVKTLPDFTLNTGVISDQIQECKSPTDSFIKVVGPAIKDLVFQTNLYAVQKFKPINIDEKELYAFIGINFFMGYHSLPSWKDYWSTSKDLGVPFVNKKMSRRRFEEILRYLHVNDNSVIPEKNVDKIYKIRPLVETLNKQFEKVYNGTRELAVDESMILFKGRSSLKQYNPKKPIKRGSKCWCLADQKGFIKRFEIYQGKNEVVQNKYAGYGLGERVVLSITENEWGKYKIICFDNYFSSLNLMEKLKLEKCLAMATFRSDRKGGPSNLKGDKSLNRGDFDYRLSNTGISYYKWKDNKAIHFLSNFHGNEQTTVKRTDHTGKKFDVTCPDVVPDYNKYMGGVDLADQLRSYYCVNRRSNKWWHRLFWGLLDISFVNAYVLYTQYTEEDICLLQFRRQVTQGLLTLGISSSRRETFGCVKRRKYNYSVSDDVRLTNVGAHYVVYTDTRKRCEMCSAKCIQSKPFSKCIACGVQLCCNEKKNCFVEYHELQLL